MGTLNILDTGNKYGNMNTAKAFYSEGMTLEARKFDFLKRRMALGMDKGFDGSKVFMANQNDRKGTFHILTDADVTSAPLGWSDIPEDILIINNNYSRGIVAAHPVADCPVVIVSDNVNNITAVCHCSAELINIKMPMLAVDALRKASKLLGCDSYDKNMEAYISACAGPNWEYDSYPKWATDENVWKDNIVERKNGIYNINIRQAVLRQLAKSNIENVKLKLIDTITNPNYYSNSMARVDKKKAGRNLIGAFYSEYDKEKPYVKTK